MRFSIVNLGCKVNRVEADQAASLLLSAGYHESTQEDADIIVVNTCTVTGEAEKKTRKAVRHALGTNGAACVVVTGCASAIDQKTYRDMDDRVQVVPKAELFEYLTAYAAPHGLDVPELLDEFRATDGFRTRVGVKVQDGCNNACTYCIVHVARGRARSMDKTVIERQVVSLADAGVKEIVLTGINLGTYDWKTDGGSVRLAGLLRDLLRLTASPADGVAPRFRISSIEPKNVDEDLIELLATSEGRVCRQLHLPLQAGNSKVLREMARPYQAEFFADLVTRMRTDIPQLALSTDIIAGFPGETASEFEETLAMARLCGFMKIHAFPYSQRQGTPAAARSDQIAPEVKAHRARLLRELSDVLAHEDYLRRAGTTEYALVESDAVATLESYHTVAAPQGAIIGSLVPVVL